LQCGLPLEHCPPARALQSSRCRLPF